MYISISLDLNISVIATREVEGNYKQVAQEVCSLQLDYNALLCQALAGATL